MINVNYKLIAKIAELNIIKYKDILLNTKDDCLYDIYLFDIEDCEIERYTLTGKTLKESVKDNSLFIQGVITNFTKYTEGYSVVW